ncbi:hypothetical protein [Microbulbifer sp. JMSA003]|uniref:hypothetical protein n=1 Tax=unclassified Microbulbifer TaxID=2619833 RepID=UPI00403911D3
MRTNKLIVAFLFINTSGCVYYPSLDYVEYYGVDYGYAHGSQEKIYYRDHSRVTKKTDTIFHFAIGAKKLDEYGGNRGVASSTITREVTRKEGYCPNGYKIDFHPTITTGDHGFAWKVFCQ